MGERRDITWVSEKMRGANGIESLVWKERNKSLDTVPAYRCQASQLPAFQ
jgi:hypothetical protein